MSRYQITYTYTGEIVDEVEAETVEEALKRAQDGPCYRLTAMAEGMEIDLYQQGKPHVTVVPGPVRCPECLGEGGRHNTIHEAGVTRPCSLRAQSASV